MIKPSPTVGDVVLYCPHALSVEKHHWFKTYGIGFKRPDGSQGSAEWLTCCKSCFQRYPDPFLIPVGGDLVWQDNLPLKYVDEVVQ